MRLLTRFRFQRIVDTGIGPFSSRFLRSLLKRECMTCGGPIGERTLTRNALVVDGNEVVLRCLPCRGLPEIALAEHGKDWFNVPKVKP